MALMNCPTCGGTGRARTVGRRGSEPVILDTKCSTCDGKGSLEVVSYDPPAPAPAAAAPKPPPLEIWPFLLPIAAFGVFFLWLWL